MVDNYQTETPCVAMIDEGDASPTQSNFFVRELCPFDRSSVNQQTQRRIMHRRKRAH